MAKFAPVAPPHFLRALNQVGIQWIGRYHLVLAHYVAAEPELYRDLLPSGSFVIMDNSLIELGEPVTGEVMKAACGVIKPSCIVLPDHKDDWEKTVEMSTKAAETWSQFGASFMAVPQGKNLFEYERCAREMAKIRGVAYWGVPRFATGNLGTRENLVDLLSKINIFGPEHRIHLLGFSNQLADDINVARHRSVMGIDSTVPHRIGQLGTLIDITVPDNPPRGDFWERPVSMVTAQTIANIALVRSWIL